ncbi:ABC transporter permease [Congregicoccus parvus]|uniref:ABC transporter permease n=1 Tax=Congregicoccus parvus TaxID=3081749 RepID=UPI003FA59B7C
MPDSAAALSPPASPAERTRPAGTWPWSPWSIFVLVTTAAVALPLAAVLAGLFASDGTVWTALPFTTIRTYVINSLLLVAGVVTLATLMGVATGWLVAACEFPGRRWFAWMLVLPLAIPGYIAAYGHGDLLDRAIPLIVWVRGTWGFETSRLVHDALRYAAVITVLGSVLYPYVYLAARTTFAMQGRSAVEAARLLGCGPWSAFARVSLPLARPAIAAGAVLVGMEVLNDYGAVSYFGVPTLTVGIFRFWFSFGDSETALRLAALALVTVFVLIALERWARGRSRFAEPGGTIVPLARFRLGRWNRWIAVGVCTLPVAIGFALPVGRLLHWAWIVGAPAWEAEFVRSIAQTLSIALAATALVLLASLIVGYAERIHPGRALRWCGRFAGLGYAVPAAILALGLMRAMGGMDALIGGADGPAGMTGSLLGGTVLVLLFAYVVRFLAVALFPVRAGLERVCGDLDASARCLGARPSRTLVRVDLPLLRGTLGAAAVLVFVDVLKELPLTLLLRPFNFETLGTRAFNLVDQGRLQESAPACLLVIAAGLACVYVIDRVQERATR